jgi:N utilization substance protein A
MVNGQEFLEAIYSIADEKRIDKDIILEGVREGFQKAYEKYFDPDAIIRVDIDQEAGQIKVFRELAVVQKVEDEISEISLTEAQAKYDADAVVGGGSLWTGCLWRWVFTFSNRARGANY